MRKNFLRIGGILAALAVILGAFGAHTLEEAIAPDQLEIFKTGVTYQFYHSFAILIVAVLGHFGRKSRLVIAGWLFVGGIILFSGSLYLLAVREVMNLNVAWLGPITPVGGTLFIVGWVFFILATFQEGERKKS
ncbi:MAG: DUF423 domain-containing protein, partial [Bacteroidota bacterium]